MRDPRKFWWKTEVGTEEVHRAVFEYAETIERENAHLYQRFLDYATLYDPHDRLGLVGDVGRSAQSTDSYVATNVVRSAVDTLSSIVAKSRPRVAVNTDGGDWSTQRTARWLERYIEALLRMTRFHEKAQDMFVDACVLGTGALKITPARRKNAWSFDVDRVLIDEIIVDERECRGRDPRHMMQRSIVDREDLADDYPEFEEEIMSRRHGDGSSSEWSSPLWAGYRPVELNQTMIVEAWRLPRYDRHGVYHPGRHIKTAPGVTLLDEDWKFDRFPFVGFRWAARRVGFYGRGVAEELAGRQRAINRMNWQCDRRLQQLAVPRIYVHPIDANLMIKLVNTAGAVIPMFKGPPHIETPVAVSSDEWMRLERLISDALPEVGVSPFSARATKPGGVESAVAMRELTDTESERFARPQQNYETVHVRGAEVMAMFAKDMGKNAPELPWRTNSMAKTIPWSEVDLGDSPYSLILDAAGQLARTPAGRMQRVIELAQSGLVGSDEARRMLDHPDLARTMSLVNSAIEAVEYDLEAMIEGTPRTIEPYMNVALSMGRAMQELVTVRNEGAPEELLNRIQSYINSGEYIMRKRKAEQAAQMMPPPGMAPPGMPPAGPPGMLPPPGQPGMPAQPDPALADQAMNLQTAA